MKTITQAEVQKMVDAMLDTDENWEFGVSYSSRMKENDKPMYYEIVNNMSDSLSKDGYIVEDWND
mgnify:CR=1 FL=1